ncbi:outer membrane protein [Bradyrhizobium sp.]|uniref:outer membrane protein n=1 Tax=Bradyrhizobium sp. TaxID=376 RepID=UPI00273570D6|nr:outer membrane beta-barrel protein [Bradyrhizobium sp.]MDP3079087.1 outer membrane beta-barrel protein [Bradyrhizobium sp.]
MPIQRKSWEIVQDPGPIVPISVSPAPRTRADPLPSNAVFGSTSGIFNQRGGGAVAGGQVGYNWQATRNWVLGVEGDLSWTGIGQDSSTAILPVGNFVCVARSSTMGRDVNWLATVRGRVGYAWDRALFYATGGVAFSDLSYRGGFVTAAAVGAPPVYTAPVAFSSTKTGWVVGSGLEYGLASNWIIRGEYLFYHFDGDTANGSDPRFAAPLGTAYTWNDTKLHVARLGLNYKFNQGSVVAKY